MQFEVLVAYAVVALVLGAEFVNGWTDAPNATASAVATKLLTRKQALWVAASMNGLGLIPALIFGPDVGDTVGKELVNFSEATGLLAIGCAMTVVIVWGIIAAYIGLPVSKSHATFAALAGAAYQVLGPDGFVLAGWIKVGKGILISIFLSVPIAWLAGRYILQTMKVQDEATWRKRQLCTVVLVASVHGWNDGLKYAGVLAQVLKLGKFTDKIFVSGRIILVCAIVMFVGTLCGGWRIVKRIGVDMTNNKYDPWQGVGAEGTAALLIGLTALTGIPMSTTHTVVSAMVGAKAAQDVRSVHWATVGLVAWGWLLTPIFCGLSAYWLTGLIV